MKHLKNHGYRESEPDYFRLKALLDAQPIHENLRGILLERKEYLSLLVNQGTQEQKVSAIHRLHEIDLIFGEAKGDKSLQKLLKGINYEKET